MHHTRSCARVRTRACVGILHPLVYARVRQPCLFARLHARGVAWLDTRGLFLSTPAIRRDAHRPRSRARARHRAHAAGCGHCAMQFACPRHTAAPTCSLTHSRRRAPARARSTAAATAAAAAAEAASGGAAAVEHVLYTGAPHTSPALEALAAGTHDARAPVVLVHGSFHAAWCWADGGVLQELAAGGRRVVAYSLRGQGGSDAPGGVDYAPALEEHTADLAAVVKQVSAECGGAAPVVVGHSFGGLVVQQYASGVVAPPAAAAFVLAASVPPSGNRAMIGRFFRRDPLASVRLTWAFAAGAARRDAALCRSTFFSGATPDEVVQAAMARMAEGSNGPLLDLKRLEVRLAWDARACDPRALPPRLKRGHARTLSFSTPPNPSAHLLEPTSNPATGTSYGSALTRARAPHERTRSNPRLPLRPRRRRAFPSARRCPPAPACSWWVRAAMRS